MISATKKRRRSCAIESSTNRRCEYAWNRWDLSTSHRSITTKRWSRPPRRWAGNSRSKVTNQSAAKRRSGRHSSREHSCCSRSALSGRRSLGTRRQSPRLHRVRLFVRWLLRRQPLDSPRFALARIAKAIMQAVGTALPEFDSLRFHPITTPVGWTGNFLAGKSLF